MIERRQVYIALAFFTVFSIGISTGTLHIYTTTGEQLIDMKFNYTPDEVYETLTGMGEEGRDVYLYVMLADLYYPLAYGALLMLAIGYVIQRVFSPESMLQKLMFLPLIAGSADVGENVCLATILYAFPARVDDVARVANGFTIVKNLALLASIVLAIGGLLYLWRKRKKDAE